MNDQLKEISAHVAKGAHALLLCNGASRHQTGGELKVPDNITMMFIPPYSPELNPMENVWQYLRHNQLVPSSGKAMRRLSMPASTLGTSSSMIPAESSQLGPDNGHASNNRRAGIILLDRL